MPETSQDLIFSPEYRFTIASSLLGSLAPVVSEQGFSGCAATLCHKEIAANGHELGNHSIFHPCCRDSGWLQRAIAELFVAVRGPFNNHVPDVSTINVNVLGHFALDHRKFGPNEKEIIHAASSAGWIIYMIYGVREGTHGFYMDSWR